MTDLSQKTCIPCKGDVPALTAEEIAQYRKEVPEWEVDQGSGEPRLKRTFRFKDFVQALAFTNQVGDIAEQQDHHPALLTEWGKVTVFWWTHKIHGLHSNDFIMAAKTDALYGA